MPWWDNSLPQNDKLEKPLLLAFKFHKYIGGKNRGWGQPDPVSLIAYLGGPKEAMGVSMLYKNKR